jgi:quinol monooxygenase YgiN
MKFMADSSIVLNVLMEAAPGRGEDVAKALGALLAPTRKEPGCLDYQLHRDPENPLKFFFYERFKNQAALDTHIASPHFQAFVKYRDSISGLIPVTNVTRWHRVD